MFTACNGRRSTSLTKATDNERLKINGLIKKIDFASAARNQKISTYATFSGFRLDNEQPTGNFAKFRIQSGKKTYGDVLITIGKNFGVRQIRNAFVKSVFCAQIFELV